MKNATTVSEIVVNKTISATEDGLMFSYQIVPPQEPVDRLQLVEQFREPIAHSAVKFTDHSAGEWTYETAQRIVFTSRHPSTEPIEAAFHIDSQTLAPEQCMSTVTTVDCIATDSPSSRNHADIESRLNVQSTSSAEVEANGGEHKKPNTENDPKVAEGISSEHGTPAESVDRPAVGVLSTGAPDGVARTVHRAIRKDLNVFVAVSNENSQLAAMSRRLGATVVEVSSSSLDEQKASLLRAVQVDSFPGMIFVETCAEPIAIDASLEAFELSDERIVNAVREPSKTSVLVGIPAYNEAKTIRTVVESAQEYADEVLVVDDGSTDQTPTRARMAGATVVEHDRNQGYGSGLKTLFEEADRRNIEQLVILDGDGQHETRDISRLLATHRESAADIVIGNRFGGTSATEMPLYRRCGLWVINLLVNLSMRNLKPSTRIQDAQSGFRLYAATAVNSMVEHSSRIDDGMSASIDILSVATIEDLRIIEMPTTISYDVSNANTRHPVSHGFDIFCRIFTTLERKRPLAMFGLSGVFISVSGIGLGYRTLSNFTSTGTFAVEPAVLSWILVLFGIILLIVSVVQHSLNISFAEFGLEQH